jgi:xanthine dehydrogenase accessory factor
MLLMTDGRTAGSISPGCLEADLLERVRSVWEQGTARLIDYDLREERDPVWGQTIGCGGAIRILLEPVRGRLLDCLLRAKRFLDDGFAARMVRKISLETGRVRYRLQQLAAADLPNRNSFVVREAFREHWVVSEWLPKPRLIVFGAGNDAMPLVEIAAKIGFRPFVVDWRPGMCTHERFPTAKLLVGFPEQALQELQLVESDYVVVMSHHLERDRQFLYGLSGKKLKYVGIMGSVSRTEKLLEGMRPMAWFHYPVGLDIEADGQEEIAIAVAAELLQVRRGNRRRKEKWCALEA